jgi:glycosyltransferase involved in cell wall biosynthesis
MTALRSGVAGQCLEILILGPNPNHPGGMALYTTMLARALAKYARVQVICIDPVVPPGLYPFVGTVSGSTTEPRTLLELSDAFRLDPFSLRSWVGFVRRLKDRPAETALIEWWSAAVSPTLALASVFLALRGIKIYLDVHETVDPSEERLRAVASFGKWILRGLARRTDTIVHSETQASALRALLGASPAKVRFIPHPLYSHYPLVAREAAFRELGLQRKYLILAFGTIRAYKGLDTLLAAYESLPAPLLAETQLAIVGGTWHGESEKVLGRAQESAAADGILVRPEYVVDRELGLWFSAADLVVQVYRRGAPSGVTSIAMAYGLPCIVSTSVVADRLRTGYGGIFTVNPNDSQALRSRIQEVLSSPRIRYMIPSGLDWDSAALAYLEYLRGGP